MSTNHDILSAVIKNDISALEKMKQQNIDIHAIWPGKSTVIAAIQMQGHAGDRYELIKWLFENGAEIDKPDNEGQTPLMAATWGFPIPEVFMDKKEAQENAKAELPIKLIELLLQYKPNINHVNQDGETALSLAAFSFKNALYTRKFLELGANVSVMRNHNDKFQHLPPTIARLLVKNGALQYFTDNITFAIAVMHFRDRDYKLYQEMLAFCLKNNYTVTIACLAFHTAQFDSSETVNQMFEDGVPIDLIKDIHGEERTLYSVARDNRNVDGYPIASIIECTCDLFHYISGNSLSRDHLKEFVDLGINLVYRQLIDYNTPLHLACSTNMDIANILLEHIATLPKIQQEKILTARNKQNKTPLDLATDFVAQKNLKQSLLIPYQQLIQPFVARSVANTKAIQRVSHCPKFDILPAEIQANIYGMEGIDFGSNSVVEAAYLRASSDNAVILDNISKRILSTNILSIFRESLSRLNFTNYIDNIIMEYCDEVEVAGIQFQWHAKKQAVKLLEDHSKGNPIHLEIS